MKTLARRAWIGCSLIAIGVGVCGAQDSARDGRIAVAMESGPVEVTFLARSLTGAELTVLRKAVPNLSVIVGVSREEALRSPCASSSSMDSMSMMGSLQPITLTKTTRPSQRPQPTRAEGE